MALCETKSEHAGVIAMDENIRWALGIVATIFLAFAGFVTRALKSIRDSVKDVDSRVNEVKENYVRRDDLAIQIGSIEKTMTKESELTREAFSDLRTDMARQHGLTIAALTKREN